jgi:diguanylate cyclase (GGDEF)-like protein
MAPKGGGTRDLAEKLKGNASLWKALVDGAPIGVFLVDPEYTVQHVNPVLGKWLNKPAKEIQGKKCHEVLFGNKQPCRDGPATCPATAVFSSAKVRGPATFLRNDRSGKQQYLQIHARPVVSQAGDPLYAVEFIQDVTSEKLLKDHREEAVLRDPLTGLYNRQGFNQLLGRELKRTRRQGHPLSLCLIDLDSFKDYNEKKGEDAGDALLEGLTQILVAQTRTEVDSLARLQADTFALILPEAPHAQALRIGHRIRRAAEDARLPVSFSMAICESENAEDPDAFYHRAADVLFQAKKSGGNKTL